MIHAHGTGILLAALLLPATASALLCEDRGQCADSRLNQSYEIRRELQVQGNATRNTIKEAARRTEAYRLEQGEQIRQHKARHDLLHPPVKKPLDR